MCLWASVHRLLQMTDVEPSPVIISIRPLLAELSFEDMMHTGPTASGLNLGSGPYKSAEDRSSSVRPISYDEMVGGYDHLFFFDALQSSAESCGLVDPSVATASLRGGAVGPQLSPPPPPEKLPLRFLRAGKGDPTLGLQRYEQTLAWRKEFRVDTILMRPPHPQFELIKEHYRHFIHLRGHRNEPCFYEIPAKTNLKALREAGVSVDDLLMHYVSVIEFLWQVVEPSDLSRSIYVLDLDGIRLGDFVGDVMDFVKRASKLCSLHYPERAGTVFVINVPRWFNIIWRVVKPLVDEVTLEKIRIFRGNRMQTAQLLQEKIPIEHLPPEYGGLSVPLGQSPEERKFLAWLKHNHSGRCPRTPENLSREYCSWVPVRSY